MTEKTMMEKNILDIIVSAEYNESRFTIRSNLDSLTIFLTNKRTLVKKVAAQKTSKDSVQFQRCPVGGLAERSRRSGQDRKILA